MMNRRTTWLVVNTASGSNSDETNAAVREALCVAGVPPDRVLDVQDGHGSDRAALEAGGVDLLVVLAGDGTVNSLVTGAEGWAGEVLVLPGGTANLLARALHGEHDAVEVAAGLAAMRVQPRHCIRWRKGAALIELLAGPGAKWSDVREDLRDGDLSDIAGSTVEAVKHSTAGPRVRIVAPPLGRDEGYVGVRLKPTSGGIEVSGYGAQGFGDFLKQGLALLKRDFRDGPHEDFGAHREVTCHSIDRSPINLMIDGERATGHGEETFSLAPLDVNLLTSGNG